MASEDIHAELNINLNCVDLHEVNRDLTGGMCSFIIAHYLEGAPGLCMLTFGPEMANGTSDEVANGVFETFLEASSDEQLQLIHFDDRLYEGEKANKATKPEGKP